MARPAALLDDDAMRQFIRDVYVSVWADLPASFHESVCAELDEVTSKEGNPGNNLLPRIPELGKLFTHPTIRGALTSILGPGYHMHPHRHPHINPHGSPHTRLHQDGIAQRMHHRCRWITAMYYPQDTPVEMGPTAIVRGSQYYPGRNDYVRVPLGRRFEILARAEAPRAPHLPEWDLDEVAMSGQAGTVSFCNYDVWHRPTPNLTQNTRWMVKFLFERVEEPNSPSWQAEPSQATWSDEPRHGRMMQRLWDWQRGSHDERHEVKGSSDSEIRATARELGAKSNATCLDAIYALADAGERALYALYECRDDDDPWVRRNAGYALAAIGSAATPMLTDALSEDDHESRLEAADALADMGAPGYEAVSALVVAAHNESDDVRRVAVEAIGTVGQSSDAGVPALIGALGDEDDRVRWSASTALLRVAQHASQAVPALTDAFDDERRESIRAGVRSGGAPAGRHAGGP